MFGMSGTELGIILVVALLLLGPAKLPELARSVGKAVRDFKRATNDIRGTVESEFYRMDQSESGPTAIPPPKPAPAEGAVPSAYAPVIHDPHADQASPPPSLVERPAAPAEPGPTLPAPATPDPKS